MSREQPQFAQIVPASLTGKRAYTVQLNLTLMELWGHDTVPDDIIVLAEALSAMNQTIPEDGDYEMEYNFGTKQVKKPIHFFMARLVRSS
jgi:hypothetical protein